MRIGAMTGRTIVVGDVHGCAHELEDLLEAVALGSDDDLIFVGDLVVRGPKPRRVLKLVRDNRGRAVRGNHEHRLLQYQALDNNKGGLTDLDRRVMKSNTLRRTAAALDDEDWALIASLPLWLDAHDGVVRVVHAGLMPGLPIEEQTERTLLYLRNVDAQDQPSERREVGRPWGLFYEGPPHVCFGHNAATEPQLHPWATGLDTGCVYGGHLTAMVLAAGQAVPPPRRRRQALVAVPARRTYHPIE